MAKMKISLFTSFETLSESIETDIFYTQIFFDIIDARINSKYKIVRDMQ